MQIQAAESGDGWVLYIKERKVGYIRGDHLGFIGFASEDEAAQAACIAHCALAMVRAKATPSAPEEYLFGHTEEGQFVIALSGVVARLLRPESRYAEDGWGFASPILSASCTYQRRTCVKKLVKLPSERI